MTFASEGPTKYRGMDEGALEADGDKTLKPFFYKDGGLRSFDGRSKSQLLKAGEGYYKSIGVNVDIDRFYGSTVEEVRRLIKPFINENIITGIELGEDMSFVFCSNGDFYKAKNIYWGSSLPELIEVTNNKNIFPASIMQGLENLK